LDDNVIAADDYLSYVDEALAEAGREIRNAAQTSVESTSAAERLGASLGSAKHAINRAQNDLAAYKARRRRNEDRSVATEAMPRLLKSGAGTDPRLVVAVLPLPFEEERISISMLSAPDFRSRFAVWVSRFNNDERRNRDRFLLTVPGSQTSSLSDGLFHFSTTAQRSTDEREALDLHASGAVVYTRRIYSHTTPQVYSSRIVALFVETALRFVSRLYEECQLAPRALAVQLRVANVDGWDLDVSGTTDGIGICPPEDKQQSNAVQNPIVLAFPISESQMDSVATVFESAIEAEFGRGKT